MEWSDRKESLFNFVFLKLFYLIFQLLDLIWESGRLKHQMMMQQYVYFHHDKYLTIDFFTNNFIHLHQLNCSIVVKKSSHQYMSRPFGQCYDYGIPIDLTYYSISFSECYRKCLAHHYIKQWDCVPYIMDKFITEYDLTNNETKKCSTNAEDVMNKRQMEKDFVKRCSKICPKECFRVEYSSVVKYRNNYFFNQVWINSLPFDRAIRRSIVWDSSEPMFAYIDEPVMTFTQYLVYCGGLMGLWFGQSLKDMFSLLIDKSFWRSIISKILFIHHFIKQKFLIISMIIYNRFKQQRRKLNAIVIFHRHN